MRLVCLLVFAFSLVPSGDCAPQDVAARLQRLEIDARKAVERGDLTTAAQRYREAIALDPKNPRTQFSLGVTEAAAGNLTAARKALETADALRPESGLALTMLVKVTLAGGDTDRATEWVRSAAKRFPLNGQLHRELARLLTEHKLFELALAEWLRVEQSESLDPEATVTTAALEHTVGAFKDSIRRASPIEDNNALPPTTRAAAAAVVGRSYAGLDQSDEAVQHLNVAIQLDPSREDSYLALASSLEKAGRYSAAVEALEQRTRNVPNAKPLLLPLGSDLVWAGRYAEGAQVLAESIKQSPGELEAYFRLAAAYDKLGQPSRETEVLQQLLARKPDYPMAHVMMATALLKCEPIGYPRVLDELAKAQRLTPRDADIYYLRGKVFAETKRYDEAVTELRRSIELRPLEPTPYYLLGLTYTKLGKPELAEEVLERMKQLKSSNNSPAR